ncbi:hypothetical protein CRV24_003869 [Beauveria bassiana]|nr:hypothetical protein CRV24_003869 [Beauveria bassiana]
MDKIRSRTLIWSRHTQLGHDAIGDSKRPLDGNETTRNQQVEWHMFVLIQRPLEVLCRLRDVLYRDDPLAHPALAQAARDANLDTAVRQPLQCRCALRVPLNANDVVAARRRPDPGRGGGCCCYSLAMGQDAALQETEKVLVCDAQGEDAGLASVLVGVAGAVHDPGPAGLNPSHAAVLEVGRGVETLRGDSGSGDGRGKGLVDGDCGVVVLGSDLAVRDNGWSFLRHGVFSLFLFFWVNVIIQHKFCS